MEVMRLIDELRENGLQVNSVVITRYETPTTSRPKLGWRAIKVYNAATRLPAAVG